MTSTRPTPDGPTTATEFQSNLAWLLRTASANGVDVDGGWQVRSPADDYPDWGIEIYEVTKLSGTGSRQEL